MKIAFFPSACIPFHARTLDERPLGGIETAVIRLSAALTKLNHQVVVFTAIENPALSDPLYLPMRAVKDLGEVDILIAVRQWAPLFSELKAKKKLFWTGDSYDQPQNLGIGDRRVAKMIDLLLPVSQWHARRLCEESGFPEAKVRVLRNGIHLPYFAGTEKRRPKRLMYSSTPYRGLALLPPMYLELKKRHPELELHIFSGYQVYCGPSGYDRSLMAEYEQLAKNLRKLPGCTVHNNVCQADLSREFMKSTILAYPNTFEETSCITAMEAQAAGCAIVTTALGALPETVGGAGILIAPPANTEHYRREFIDAVDRILREPSLFEKFSQIGQRRAKSFDWDLIARDLSEFLGQILQES